MGRQDPQHSFVLSVIEMNAVLARMKQRICYKLTGSAVKLQTRQKKLVLANTSLIVPT
jgi:hypothetical protein